MADKKKPTELDDKDLDQVSGAGQTAPGGGPHVRVFDGPTGNVNPAEGADSNLTTSPAPARKRTTETG